MREKIYSAVFKVNLNNKYGFKNTTLFKMLYNEYGNFILKKLVDYDEDAEHKRDYKRKIIEVYRQTYVNNNFYGHKLVNYLREKIN